jgi:hypothetical protein
VRPELWRAALYKLSDVEYLRGMNASSHNSCNCEHKPLTNLHAGSPQSPLHSPPGVRLLGSPYVSKEEKSCGEIE